MRVAIALLVGLVASGAAVAVSTGATPPVSHQAVATTPPPAPGRWRITANVSNPGEAAIDQFNGSLTVTGEAVTDLHGITQHGVNSGCIAGERVAMLGSVAIRHEVDATVGSDFWEVALPNPNAFVTVRITLQGHRSARHPAKIHHATGHLRIFFPGGTDTTGGITTYSNITFGPTPAGICNLEFSISQG
ncbi:MAG: hypothetical protein ACLP50_07920 [Solirubrobacteraceae bacterium]